jgi:hypothetical protein
VVGAEDELADVPVVSAVGEVALGSILVGLLGEALDAIGSARRPLEARAALDVAIAGFGMGGMTPSTTMNCSSAASTAVAM